MASPVFSTVKISFLERLRKEMGCGIFARQSAEAHLELANCGMNVGINQKVIPLNLVESGDSSILVKSGLF